MQRRQCIVLQIPSWSTAIFFWLQVPSQEGRKNPNKAVKEVDEEEEENKMREEAGLTRYQTQVPPPTQSRQSAVDFFFSSELGSPPPHSLTRRVSVYPWTKYK